MTKFMGLLSSNVLIPHYPDEMHHNIAALIAVHNALRFVDARSSVQITLCAMFHNSSSS